LAYSASCFSFTNYLPLYFVYQEADDLEGAAGSHLSVDRHPVASLEGRDEEEIAEIFDKEAAEDAAADHSDCDQPMED
jgi:hypothetical protein